MPLAAPVIAAVQPGAKAGWFMQALRSQFAGNGRSVRSAPVAGTKPNAA